MTTAQVDTLVQVLPALQHLALFISQSRNGSTGPLQDGFPAGIATSCSQLRCLEIGGKGHGSISGKYLGALPPELGHMAALTRLQLLGVRCAALPDSISQLSELRELDMAQSEIAGGLLLGLTACRELTKLQMDMPSSVVAHLVSLRFLGVPCQRAYSGNAWTHLTNLTELHLAGEPQCSLPVGLGDLKELRKLSISRANLVNLPNEEYLSRLESLFVHSCDLFESGALELPGLPAALAAATQLRNLDLDIHRLQLTAADRAVLTSLPALASLSLKKPHGISQLEWDGRLLQLQSRFAEQGRRLPNSRVRISDELVGYIVYQHICGMCESLCGMCTWVYQVIDRFCEDVCLFYDGQAPSE